MSAILERAIKANDKTLTHTFYSGETATDAVGNVVVVVERADGTSLTGGTIAANNGSTGEYDFDLTAAVHLTELDLLKVTWTATVASKAVSHAQYVRITDAHYFELSELRIMSGLDSTTVFPTSRLRDARDYASEFVEQFTEASWVPSFDLMTIDGDDSECVFLRRLPGRRIIGVTIGGTAQTITSWTISSTGLVRTAGTSFSSADAGQNVVVQYEHGELFPPADMRHAILKVARHVLLTAKTTIPDRARIMQTDWGVFHLDTASEDKPTGIPEIDAVLCRHRKENVGSFA